jgi:hypothetical protein
VIFAISGTNGGKVDKARPIHHMSRRAAGACRSPGKPDGEVQPRIPREPNMIAPFKAVHGKASPMKKSASLEEDRHDFLSRYP